MFTFGAKRISNRLRPPTFFGRTNDIFPENYELIDDVAFFPAKKKVSASEDDDDVIVGSAEPPPPPAIK